MRQDEHNAQVALVQWCEIISVSYPEVGRYIAIPNGGHRDIRTAVRLKREGVRSGVPDLFWPIPKHGFHGLFVEMKRDKGGTVTPEQKEWIAYLDSRGYSCVVCHGLREAIDAVSAYFEVMLSHT